jgi:hypothetical protein
MYKATNRQVQHRRRTGNASLTAFANGRPPLALPAEWATLEEVHRSVYAQYTHLGLEHDRMEGELAQVKAQLRRRALTTEERSALMLRQQELGQQLNRLNSERGSLRKLWQAAAELPFATVFYYLAQALLDRDVFRRLDEETRALVGRHRTDPPTP